VSEALVGTAPRHPEFGLDAAVTGTAIGELGTSNEFWVATAVFVAYAQFLARHDEAIRAAARG